jgi:hypothetical protein
MITTSAYGIVVLLIIPHTILSHLITWGFRSAAKQNYTLAIMGLVVLSLLELLLLFVTLNYYI